MNARAAYDELIRHTREEALLASCEELLGWDELTVMPKAGTAYRGEQVALLAADLRLPGMDGISATRQIKRELPRTSVLMLTATEDANSLSEALRAGAGGYILKEGLVTDLAGAVRVVAQDLGLLLSPSIASKLLVEFREVPRRQIGPNLTERELEVLRLVSRGFNNQEIADELCLSGHTVKRHVANILAKLHQRSRLDAVMYAIRSGVLAADAS
jgi:two-component system NarL family response regulator